MERSEELDQLSSTELHDRALRYAERHLDVKFFWQLLQAVPAAKAASGSLEEADEDIQHWTAAIGDLFSDDDGAMADSLRPFYLDYLQRHPKA